MMAGNHWYCRICGEVSGPFSLQELHDMKRRGKLSADAQVRQGTDRPWAPAGQLELLFPNPYRAPAPSKVGAGGTIRPQAPARSAPEARPHAAGAARPPAPRPGRTAGTPPPLPAPGQHATIRNRILIGSGIGIGVVSLILFMLFLLLSGDGRSRETLAGRGADTGADGHSGDAPEGGRGDPSAADEAAGGQAGSEQQAAAEAEDRPDGPDVAKEPAEEAEPAESPSLEEPGQEQPAEDEPPDEPVLPGAPFAIQELPTSPPPAPQPTGEDAGRRAGPGGGGAGGSDFTERLEREGARAGDVQISLLWNNFNDLDLHVMCPSGERISYRNRRSRCGGELDVDMNAGGRRSNKPVENIYWPPGRPPKGTFQVFVHHYANHGGRDPTSFRVAVTVNGETKTFSGRISHGEPLRRIHTFTRR